MGHMLESEIPICGYAYLSHCAQLWQSLTDFTILYLNCTNILAFTALSVSFAVRPLWEPQSKYNSCNCCCAYLPTLSFPCLLFLSFHTLISVIKMVVGTGPHTTAVPDSVRGMCSYSTQGAACFCENLTSIFPYWCLPKMKEWPLWSHAVSAWRWE